MGPLGASYREVARSAQMGSEWHYADQAARHERENVPTYFRDAGGTTRSRESRGRVTLEITGQISIVPNCGGNAEIDLLTLVVGRFVDDARASGR